MMQKHPVVVDHRRGRVPPDVCHVTRINLPLEFAGMVITEQPGRTMPDHHPFTVCHRRGGPVWIGLVSRLNF